MFKINANGVCSIWNNKSLNDFYRVDKETGQRTNVLTEILGVSELDLTILEIVGASAQVSAASSALTNLEKSEGITFDVILNAYDEPVLAKLQTVRGIATKTDRLKAELTALIAQEMLAGGIIDLLLIANPAATQEDIFNALNIQGVDLRAYASIYYGVTSPVALTSVTATAKLLEEIAVLVLE